MPPTEKRERKIRNKFAAAQSGRIQWTSRGVEDCVRHLQKQWLSLESRDKQKEWEPYAEILFYMHDKYGQVKATAYYYRMAAVVLCLNRHMKELKRAGIVKPDGENFACWEVALFEAFAKLPFKRLTGFSFLEVKRFVLATKKPN